MNSLIGKNILIFYPYGTTVHYGKAISKELRTRGSNVDEYDERPSQGTFSKIFIRLFKNKFPSYFNRYIKSVIKQNALKDYDYIIVLRGEAFTSESLDILKSAYPKAKTILYLWDIMRTTKTANVVNCFDSAFTFDPGDARRNECLTFRPTFFIPDYSNIANNNEQKRFHISFTGTLHSNRHIFLQRLFDYFESIGLKLDKYLFVPSRIVYLKDFFTKFPYISPRKIHFSRATLSDILKQVSHSYALLDINYTAQESLSMRAYEAMAAHRKYITTNPEVKKYDFYNPKNIMVIDLNDCQIDKNWVTSPFVPIKDEIMYKYSVPGLVDVIIGNNPDFRYFRSNY